MKRTLIVSLLVVTILLVFTLQNQKVLHVDFLFWKVSHTFVVVMALVLGVVLGITIVLPGIVSRNKKINELNHFIDDFREKERDKVEEKEAAEIEKEKQQQASERE
jgi:uncharacterized integral membrane protein